MKTVLPTRLIFPATVAGMALALCGCNIYSWFSRQNTPSASLEQLSDKDYSIADSDDDGVYVEKDGLLPYSLRKLIQSNGSDALDSNGKRSVLVLPIEFSDYPFPSSYSKAIEDVLNGEALENGQSGVSRFYFESSFHKLDLSFKVQNPFKVGLTAKNAYKRFVGEAGKNDYGQSLVSAAVESLRKRDGFDITDFDLDKDGSLDYVLAIYSTPFVFASPSVEEFDKEQFFASYTYWAEGRKNPASPGLNLFTWLSFDAFFGQGHEADSHSLIHTIGHALGLPDQGPTYVGADGNKPFHPLGEMDLMDGNIGDHNCFSKALLGWNNPKITYDSCEVSLNPSWKDGDCLLIPAGNFHGSLYDEYLLLEYYCPEGLNAYDATHPYYSSKGFGRPGVKLYHVDARVICVDVDMKNNEVISKRATYYHGENIQGNLSGGTLRYFRMAASNDEKDPSIADPSFSLIHLLESGGENTLASGAKASDASLFHEGDVFGFGKRNEIGKTYGEAFLPKGGSMNNGESFPFEITVSSLDEEARIIIRKNS